MIYGNAGNDILVGGQGSDILFGGLSSMGQVLVGGDANDSGMSMISNPMMWNANTTPDAAMDTFVFQSGDGSMSFMNATGIADYTDGTDKIAYNSGFSYVSNPFAGGQLTAQAAFGNTAVQEVSSGMYLFYVSGTVTFDDSDVTTDVTV